MEQTPRWRQILSRQKIGSTKKGRDWKFPLKRQPPKTQWIGFLWILVLLACVGIWWNEHREVSKLDFPMVGRKFVLDPGHGGFDGGATGINGIIEKDITLKISLYLRDYLQESGAGVLLTRERDIDLSHEDTQPLRSRKSEDLLARVQFIKDNQPADALISIHLNAIPDQRWKGAQTFYPPTRVANAELAASIQDELIRNLENTSRVPVKRDNVYILKHSPIPAVLVEVGFLSNPEESVLLSTTAYQKKVAASIYYGLLKNYTSNRV